MTEPWMRWTLAAVTAIAFGTAAWLLVSVAQLAGDVSDYVEVSGEVVGSRLDPVDEAADLWRPVATVRYRVADLEYLASSQAMLSSRPREQADTWLASHPEGAAIPVFHAPGDPGAARLTREVSILQPVAAFFITLIAMVLSIRWAVARRGVIEPIGGVDSSA